MKTSDSKNLLDEDDALDYILYEEMEKGSKQRGNRKGGCLVVFVAVLIPVGGWLLYNQLRLRRVALNHHPALIMN
jgi:hypothetical protein